MCVVGGGVAGLAVAAHLVGAGFETLVVEASEQVGGRARDARADGYTLADGWHLLHTSWPALRNTAGPARLALSGFAPGVRLHLGGRRLRFGAAPTRPQQAFSTLRTPLGSPADKARLSKLWYRLAMNAPERALTGPEHSSAEAFAARGYSAEIVERFLRPYLAGFAADEDLATSSRGADWLMRLLVRGRFAMPAAGIGMVPRELARRLPPGAVLLGTAVRAVRADRVLTDAGEIRASAVVVATDPDSAVRLFPGLHEPRMRAITTLWHAADDDAIPYDADRAPAVLIDGEHRSPIARTAVVSRVAPELAPRGKALIATAVVGHDGESLDTLERDVRGRLAALHAADTSHWQTLDIRHVERAVVAMPAPHNFTRPVRLIDGLYVCGDHRDLPNIEGAVQSAHRTAAAVAEDLAGRR